MRRDAESTANGKSTLIITGACETDFVVLRDGNRNQAKGSNEKKSHLQPGSHRKSLQAGHSLCQVPRTKFCGRDVGAKSAYRPCILHFFKKKKKGPSSKTLPDALRSTRLRQIYCLSWIPGFRAKASVALGASCLIVASRAIEEPCSRIYKGAFVAFVAFNNALYLHGALL